MTDPFAQRYLESFVVVTGKGMYMYQTEMIFEKGIIAKPKSLTNKSKCTFKITTGYPDLGTRRFIDKLSQAHTNPQTQFPIFIITDADPHGISIAACYIQASPTSHVRWLGIHPSHNRSLFHIPSHSLLPLSQHDNFHINATMRRLASLPNELAYKFLPLVSELMVLQNTQVKFEMEALSALHQPNNCSTLLQYIITRLGDFSA